LDELLSLSALGGMGRNRRFPAGFRSLPARLQRRSSRKYGKKFDHAGIH